MWREKRGKMLRKIKCFFGKHEDFWFGYRVVCHNSGNEHQLWVCGFCGRLRCKEITDHHRR